MVLVESMDGSKKDIECIGCALQKGQVKTKEDLVHSTKHFEVRQDFEVPIPGFFVIASKRHIVGFGDFNEEEKKDFIDLLCNLRRGMDKVLDIKDIEILHREDVISSKLHPSHFHIGILPKAFWMKKYLSTIEALAFARENMKTSVHLQKVDSYIKKMKDYFSK